MCVSLQVGKVGGNSESRRRLRAYQISRMRPGKNRSPNVGQASSLPSQGRLEAWPTSEGSPATDARLLDAGAGRRQHLVGAAAVLRVEGRAQPQHQRQVLRREQSRHEVDLLDANAVLSCHTAPLANTLLEDLMTGGQHAFHLVRVALVKKQDRMQVTVASMEDIADPDIVFFADALDLAEHVRQL